MHPEFYDLAAFFENNEHCVVEIVFKDGDHGTYRITDACNVRIDNSVWVEQIDVPTECGVQINLDEVRSARPKREG